MRVLQGQEAKDARKLIEYAARLALRSTCQRWRCGSVVVAGRNVIGEGFNSPPGNLEDQRRCTCDKRELHEKITDKTCCVHAEQRAMHEALRTNPESIQGARLYFARIDREGSLESGKDPYCTVCSKSALDLGLAEVVLARPEGILTYNPSEYNLLSYQFRG